MSAPAPDAAASAASMGYAGRSKGRESARRGYHGRGGHGGRGGLVGQRQPTQRLKEPPPTLTSTFFSAMENAVTAGNSKRQLTHLKSTQRRTYRTQNPTDLATLFGTKIKAPALEMPEDPTPEDIIDVHGNKTSTKPLSATATMVWTEEVKDYFKC
jgi:hypothetical protein